MASNTESNHILLEKKSQRPKIYLMEDIKEIKKKNFTRICVITVVIAAFVSVSLLINNTIEPKQNSPKISIKKSIDYKTTNWTGGITREIAIYPEDALYKNKDFIFRVSSAVVKDKKSDFTKLKDYNRILMILSNKLDLIENNKNPITMKEFEQIFFDGASDTKSVFEGEEVTDFNLMMRKDKCKGNVVHMLLTGEKEYNLEKNYNSVIILAVDGELSVEHDKKYELSKFDSLIVNKESEITLLLKAKTPVNLVIAKIEY